MSEVRWSCGCVEINGKLEAQCTQVQPSGEISAAAHAVNRPFARKCARLAYEQAKASANAATPTPEETVTEA